MNDNTTLSGRSSVWACTSTPRAAGFLLFLWFATYLAAQDTHHIRNLAHFWWRDLILFVVLGHSFLPINLAENLRLPDNSFIWRLPIFVSLICAYWIVVFGFHIHFLVRKRWPSYIVLAVILIASAIGFCGMEID